MLYYRNFILVSVSNYASFVPVPNCTEPFYVIVADHASAAVKQRILKGILNEAQFDFTLTPSSWIIIFLLYKVYPCECE